MNNDDQFKVVGAIIGIIFIVALAYGGWYLKRSVNAWLYYDDATTEQVCKMIKPEYIKDGYCN